MVEDAADKSGLVLEHYRLEALIDQGGMGAVYRGVDENLARPVAVKVMNEELAAHPDFQKRFQQEAQAAARLQHPSIVHIYDSGETEGSSYIVMELIPGLSLGDYMKQLAGRNQIIRLEETLTLTAQVAEALGYAHRKGVIHLDVKPDNILVKELDQEASADTPPLRAVLTDFGLAKLQEANPDIEDGERIGTLNYMSPEQLLEQAVDGRSDLYSLGVVLFQMATGQLPFLIKSPSDAVYKHVHQTPPIPHELFPGLPLSLGQVIWKALAKKPADRYQTGEEMARALRQVAANLADEDLKLDRSLDQASMASMVLTLDEDSNLADTSRWLGDEEARPPRYDTLRVNHEGEDPEWYGLHKKSYSIGRSEGNDIVLVGSNVSRWHARIEYINNSWHIVDSGSTNGTFLGKVLLVPEKAYPWRADQVVTIGPFELHLQVGAEAGEPRPQVSEKPVAPVDPQSEPRQALPLAPPTEVIVADLRPPELRGVGIARVLILNEGHRRSTITVAVGDPKGKLRVDAPSKQVTIDPGQKGIIDFYLEGKRPLIGRRQSYPYTMQISTSEREWDVLEAVMKVKPIFSIWLVLFLLLLIALVAAAIYGFFNELLPWTPQSLLDDILTYLQGL